MNFLFFAMFMSKVELKTGTFAFFVQALQISVYIPQTLDAVLNCT